MGIFGQAEAHKQKMLGWIGLLLMVPLIFGSFQMVALAIGHGQIVHAMIYGGFFGAWFGMISGLRTVSRFFVTGITRQAHVVAYYVIAGAILGPPSAGALVTVAFFANLPFVVFGLAWMFMVGGLVKPLTGLALKVLPRRILPSGAPQTQNIHGSARWGSPKDAESRGHLAPLGQIKKSGLMYGRFDKGVPKNLDPRFQNDGHILVCAPTGAGKGVGFVIPNLLSYEGSVVCLDLKGENYAVTHRHRQQMGHRICLIDPWGVCKGERSASLDWLAAIDVDDPDAISQAGSLADMIVIGDGGGDSAHWEENAKDILRGLILWHASQNETIADVRASLTASEADQEAIFAAMQLSEEAHGVIARSANAFLAKPDKERGSVLSTAQRHTAFLDDPRIRACVSGRDFSLADLKKELMTVYLVLPPKVLAQQARFIRGIVGLTLAAITADANKPAHNVLMMLDEFAQLGPMPAITDALALIRGYGGSIAILVQDLGQLKAAYKEKAGVYLSNCSQVYFGTGDNDTAESISKSLGQWTAEYQTSSRQDTGQGSQGQQFTARSLLTADEVRRLPADRAIAFVRGEPAYLLQRLSYLADPEYRGRFDGNPYHA